MSGGPSVPQAWIDSLGAIPHGPLAATIALLVAGLILWLSGRKVLKPVFALVGAGVGGLAGSLVLPSMGVSDAFGVPSPTLGGAGGAFLGLIGAILLFRLFVASATAVTVSLAGLIVAAAALQFTPGAEARPGGPVAIKDRVVDHANRHRVSYIDESFVSEEQPAARVREFVGDAAGELRTVWSEYPADDRRILAGSALLGCGIGLLIGLLMPGRSCAAGTSLIGPALWIPSAAALVQTFRLPGHDLMESATPVFWAVLWGVASFVGFTHQVKHLARKKPQSAAVAVPVHAKPA